MLHADDIEDISFRVSRADFAMRWDGRGGAWRLHQVSMIRAGGVCVWAFLIRSREAFISMAAAVYYFLIFRRYFSLAFRSAL